MEEKQYQVYEHGATWLGTFRNLDLALTFIEGYARKYYNETLDLAIREMPDHRVKANCEEDKMLV